MASVRGRVSGILTRALTTCVAGLALFGGEASAQNARPNIVFIGAEDISPDLGCYGNKLMHTPNLDRLASQGAMFTNMYGHAPVSAPSRSGMITGMYPTSIGTHHMRSKLISPPRTFTQELRDAGYYVRWASKTDFNFDVPKDCFDSEEPWLSDEAMREVKAQGRPFFLHVNFMTTHESHVFGDKESEEHAAKLASERRIDPAKVTVPAFYPDTPEVRRDIARYLNNISAMDQEVGEVLDLLERNGMSENTMIVFWGDNGRGMPRHKRWCYRSGIRIPMIVRWAGKIAPGTVREDLVSAIDFAPTFLTAAGVQVPERMQGQTFLTPDGKANPEPRQLVFSARDRMDGQFDRIRSVHDGRWHYIRNFYPQLPYDQPIEYESRSIVIRTWRELNEQGKLTGAPALYFQKTKPKEELYDMLADPDEVNNLAESPAARAQLTRLSGAMDEWVKSTNDLGAVPEDELIARGLVRDLIKNYANQGGSPLPPAKK